MKYLLNFMATSALLFVTAFSPSSAQDTSNFLGGNMVWKNQLNSILTIEKIDPITQQITGNYQSPSGTTGQKFAVIGFINSALSTQNGVDKVTVISFTVRWGTIGSITSWNGVYRPKDKKIIAQWFLSRPVTDFEWSHIMTGQDTFTPQ